MSVKRIVTGLRSPSAGEPLCEGPDGEEGGCARGTPQFEQNLAAGATSAPQDGQTAALFTPSSLFANVASGEVKKTKALRTL
jgi:hypothetical protein